MSHTIIRQKLSQYSAKIHGGQALFTYPAVANFVEKLPGFNCLLPLGRIEAGERSAPREIIWHAEGEGRLVPFAQLGDAEQVRLRKQVEDSLNLLHQEARRLKSDSSRAKRDLGAILEKIESPPDEFLYILDGKPVITGWGLTEEGPEPEMITTGSHVGPGPDTGTGNSGTGIINDPTKPQKPKVEEPLPPPPPPEKTAWWPWAALAVLLVAGAAALAYWLLYEPPLPLKPIVVQKVPPPAPVPEVKKVPPPEPVQPVERITSTETTRVKTVETKPPAEPPPPIPKEENIRIWDDNIKDYVWVRRETVWWTDGTIIWDPVLKRYYCRNCADRIVREEPGRTIKVGGVVQEAVRYIELTVDPPDPAAQWKITINPGSSEEVLKEPEKFIQFYKPQKGLEAWGSSVRLAVVSGKAFDATVTATDSKGKRSFHEIRVPGAGR